jgi:hypothetical protein
MWAVENFDAYPNGDPAEFMRRVWGHSPKKLKNDASVVSGGDEDDDDSTQSGGPGFNGPLPGNEREVDSLDNLPGANIPYTLAGALPLMPLGGIFWEVVVTLSMPVLIMLT